MENNAAQAALESIRNTIAHQEKVVFVFHPWHDFNNLAMGFKFPAIPMDVIPRLTLIPMVTRQGQHIESRISDRSPNLTVVPSVITHTREIEEDYSDLLHRFSKYGLTRIPALDCSLDDVDRIVAIFNRMMQPFTGVLQDLPEYFGQRSPVTDVFGPDSRRINTTAKAVLTALAKEGEISEPDLDRFLKAVVTLGNSAVVAHRHALTPTHGILTGSIININAGDKASFDETDQFLIRQFPAFSADSRVSKKTETDGITKLADLLADRLGASRQEVVEAVAPAAAPAPTEELDTVENGPELDKAYCKAISKTTNEQCRRPAEDNGYCIHPAHAAQARVEAIVERNEEVPPYEMVTPNSNV